MSATPTIRVNEDDLDRLIETRMEAARDASLVDIERARLHTRWCPPCTGNCVQGRQCPERVRRRVEADTAESSVSNRLTLLIFAVVVLAFAAAGALARLGVLA